MENKINSITREAKIEFLNKIRAGDQRGIISLRCQLMTTEQLLERLYDLLLPWMKAHNFQDIESLEEAMRKEGIKLNDRFYKEVFKFYQQEI